MSELIRIGRVRDKKTNPPACLQAWLDDLEGERDVLIMRLRQVDRVLVQHGRLKTETLERRAR